MNLDDEEFRLAKERLDGVAGCSCCVGVLIIAAILVVALILVAS